MYHKDYSNFVRQTFDDIEKPVYSAFPNLSGKDAKKLYLEEIENVKDFTPTRNENYIKIDQKRAKLRISKINININDKELFQRVQNNDIESVRYVLDNCPDKINIVDDFGWNMLMIACQANSIDTVKELLKRGINTSVRDKAGNSAQSLVIKNKNKVLADILLSFKEHESIQSKTLKVAKVKFREEYKCEVCDSIIFPDKVEHLSSTLHNINASKGKKIPSKYVIPETNKGYQIMLKEGWDKEVGLGPRGTGAKYPIKAIMKKDRTGFGLKKKENCTIKETPKNINKKFLAREKYKSKVMEINFRREFY